MPLTPHDILYLTLAACVLALTGFLCWLIFYGIQILKSASIIVNEIRDRLLAITDILSDIGTKIERVYEMMSSFSGLSGFLAQKFRTKTSSWFKKKDSEPEFENEETMTMPTEKMTDSKKNRRSMK
jgi:hypothetical protein